MKGHWASRSFLGPMAMGFFLYAALLVILSGDIGFDADDWWIFSWAYWSPYPQSVLTYARELLRPIEGFYWLSMFDLLGFNRIAFHLASLLLWIGAAISMGNCLSRAFPHDRTFVITAVFMVFFLPMVSSLTYIIFTDNARLSIVLFWVSTSYFQKWAAGSLEWKGLLLPVLLYILSFLTYEAASLMILALPLLALPVRRYTGRNPFGKRFLFRLVLGIVVSLGVSLLIRFTLLSGGAVTHRHLFPPLDLIFSYLALLPHYLVAPFSLGSDALAATIGVAVAAAFAFCLYALGHTGKRELDDRTQRPHGLDSPYYKMMLGLVLFFLGMLPYQMAGYGSSSPKLSETVLAMYGFVPQGDTSWFNFNWASRIYSSASCGIAILIAAILTGFKSPTPRLVAQAAAIVAIGFMASFHAGLSKDWQEAAVIRNDLVRSLVREAPDVQSHTNFIFLDLETYHKRAAVIRRWSGLRELIRMLYDDRTLGAWYLYPYAQAPPNKQFQQAIVLAKGFVSRGLAMNAPVPHDTLLLLKRDGRQLVLLDKITSSDGMAPTGVSWQGPTMLTCNKNRIISVSSLSISRKYRCHHKKWISSLVSTLRLDDVKE